MQMSRTGWGLAAVSAVVVAVLAPDVADLVADAHGPSFPEAAVAVASLGLLGLAAWSLLACGAVVLGASSQVVSALTPALLRRALLVGAAGALTVVPAHAESLTAPSAADPARHTVSGLPLPDRPDVRGGPTARRATSPATTPVPAATPAPAPSRAVAVRPGDTLWGIAARSLPHDASVADIARATERWHHANRGVIGDDPDLIIPAQLLQPPTGSESS
ncbi:LysM peptidoglycan-binding domain-containing protein [Aeromicrobium fastidiosum]|uniref:LysM peptidoglycan-binding domain-containing protein n=1 Tax=Aeromicrobium fastidiosum TaxID=52699 RepID=A0A641ANG1_9ACTN|nr:LysM domain-containing protein [Aeromicrobium fastidiosum]KAA1378271.1 LysM peptidoglycan-binding domain-containing protein [Aeromicrobium fastidiosum]MBP2388910.1 LysM repeat protein [Aeromicrobium fastidiosum]